MKFTRTGSDGYGSSITSLTDNEKWSIGNTQNLHLQRFFYPLIKQALESNADKRPILQATWHCNVLLGGVVLCSFDSYVSYYIEEKQTTAGDTDLIGIIRASYSHLKHSFELLRKEHSYFTFIPEISEDTIEDSLRHFRETLLSTKNSSNMLL